MGYNRRKLKMKKYFDNGITNYGYSMLINVKFFHKK